jgi:hypothetical protein
MKKDWRDNIVLVLAIAIVAWLLISFFMIKCFPMSEEQYHLYMESKGLAFSNTSVMTCGVYHEYSFGFLIYD